MKTRAARFKWLRLHGRNDKLMAACLQRKTMSFESKKYRSVKIRYLSKYYMIISQNLFHTSNLKYRWALTRPDLTWLEPTTPSFPINKGLICLWPGYFLTQPDEIYLRFYGEIFEIQRWLTQPGQQKNDPTQPEWNIFNPDPLPDLNFVIQ